MLKKHSINFSLVLLTSVFFLASFEASAQNRKNSIKKTGCSRILDPRDGYRIGNVYKLSDHSPNYPVFITHNGARSGTAISSTGVKLDTFRYTGLANPDSNGRRHHYRFTRSCRSFPSNFLIKLGSICYKIASPCGRVD